MKKTICIVLSLLLLLSLAACSSSGSDPSQTQPAPNPSTAAPAPDTKAPATQAPAPDTQAPAPDTQAPAPDTQAPNTQAPEPDDEPFPTLPPVSDDFTGASEFMDLGFQWTEVFPEYEEEEANFHAMDPDDAYTWYSENGARYYFINEAGDALVMFPWGPEYSEVTSMEFDVVHETTGMEPWTVYQIPYSREITYHASRNIRPSSFYVRWEDAMVELWASNMWNAQITTSGVYFDCKNDYDEPEEPLAFELNLTLYYADIGQRTLTVTAPDSEAFLLTRNGNYVTVISKGECAVTVTDRTDGRSDVMLETRIPAGSTWYVLDLTAAELSTGFED